MELIVEGKLTVSGCGDLDLSGALGPALMYSEDRVPISSLGRPEEIISTSGHKISGVRKLGRLRKFLQLRRMDRWYFAGLHGSGIVAECGHARTKPSADSSDSRGHAQMIAHLWFSP